MGPGGELGVMSHDDASDAVVAGRAKQAHHALAVDRVERAGRLVGEQQVTLPDDRAGDRHPLPLTAVTLDLTPSGEDAVEIEATVRTTGRTGVEMEALTAASIAALTVYDMVKAVDRGMRIEALRVVAKSGGKSGDFRQE